MYVTSGKRVINYDLFLTVFFTANAFSNYCTYMQTLHYELGVCSIRANVCLTICHLEKKFFKSVNVCFWINIRLTSTIFLKKRQQQRKLLGN